MKRGVLYRVDLSNMLNGLDLFSGIGGISLALAPWVRPTAYCENDPYATAVLLSRMQEGVLPLAPIWDDVRTLRGADFVNVVDIICAGFPCQDISSAGSRAGVEGERSGLYKEIIRLAGEIRPNFIFLENVAAIVSRGLCSVLTDLTEIGYDTRWTCLRASDVGAPHLRERWWLLAHTDSAGIRQQSEPKQRSESAPLTFADGTKESMADSDSMREPQSEGRELDERGWIGDRSWWTFEPGVGRVADGIPNRVDRLRGLGNAVVPQCAREAFKRLSGIEAA